MSKNDEGSISIMSKKLLALMLAFLTATYALVACEPKDNEEQTGNETTVEENAGEDASVEETEAEAETEAAE